MCFQLDALCVHSRCLQKGKFINQVGQVSKDIELNICQADTKKIELSRTSFMIGMDSQIQTH